VDVETPVYRAASYSIGMDVRRLLVVQRKRLVGIVSALELVGALAPVAGAAAVRGTAPEA
jgi:CBS domain-containing protein